MVFRLPPYVWGNGGSFFIPLHLHAARERGKAYYILPGESQITNIPMHSTGTFSLPCWLSLEVLPTGCLSKSRYSSKQDSK